jgi:translation initiation factor IF-3
MVGVMSLRDALDEAEKVKLDLIEISPNCTPPVCKIADFGKYKYEQEKRQHESKKKQKVVELKEIKIRPNIAIGDFNIKLKSAERFLNDGNKIKVSMQFRGREITHTDVGMAVINRFKESLIEISKIDQSPRLEGKQVFMILSPKLAN